MSVIVGANWIAGSDIPWARSPRSRLHERDSEEHTERQIRTATPQNIGADKTTFANFRQPPRRQPHGSQADERRGLCPTVRLYGCTGVTRTGVVWVLLMVPSRSRFQTGCMTIETKDDVWCRPALTIETREDFHEVVLPHLAAGRRLARWLVRNPDDVDDVVQEASLRAFRYFETFTGGNGRAWFLRIVRNTCSTWQSHRSHAVTTDEFDEESHSDVLPSATPETLLLQTDDATLIERAMTHLPDRARQLLRLRELEGFSYRELADTMGIPMGTVMSGLARAREAFRDALVSEQMSRV